MLGYHDLVVIATPQTETETLGIVGLCREAIGVSLNSLDYLGKDTQLKLYRFAV